MSRQLTLAWQVELLAETFKDGCSFITATATMNDAYTRNDLNALHQLMYGPRYRPKEMKALLDDCNNDWIQQLPS